MYKYIFTFLLETNRRWTTILASEGHSIRSQSSPASPIPTPSLLVIITIATGLLLLVLHPPSLVLAIVPILTQFAAPALQFPIHGIIHLDRTPLLCCVLQLIRLLLSLVGQNSMLCLPGILTLGGQLMGRNLQISLSGLHCWGRQVASVTEMGSSRTPSGDIGLVKTSMQSTNSQKGSGTCEDSWLTSFSHRAHSPSRDCGLLTCLLLMKVFPLQALEIVEGFFRV